VSKLHSSERAGSSIVRAMFFSEFEVKSSCAYSAERYEPDNILNACRRPSISRVLRQCAFDRE
jgi:hypothetical protein